MFYVGFTLCKSLIISFCVILIKEIELKVAHFKVNFGFEFCETSCMIIFLVQLSAIFKFNERSESNSIGRNFSFRKKSCSRSVLISGLTFDFFLLLYEVLQRDIFFLEVQKFSKKSTIGTFLTVCWLCLC